MFSGIVETTGTVEKIHMESDCMNMTIISHQVWDDLNLGDSISVNGVCLTITHLENNAFQVSIVPETLRVTNLGTLSFQEEVNLERAMKLNARIGGHFVQGHVDQTGAITHLEKDGEGSLLATIQLEAQFAKYVVNKGYITIDGMSITVIEAGSHHFTVTFIPYTQEVTRVKQYIVGTRVNLEVDILGKYLEKLLEARQA